MERAIETSGDPSRPSSFGIRGIVATAGMLAWALTLFVPARTQGEEVALMTLDEAVAAAVGSHPSIQVVKAEVDAAQTKPDQVVTLSDPVFSLMTGIPFATPADPPIIEMKITQSFPLSPITTYQKQAAAAQAQAMATKIPAAQLDVALAVVLAYYEVVFLEELRAVVAEQLKLAGNIVDAVVLRFASQAGNQADIVRAQISRDEISTSLDVLDLEIQGARQVLVLLMGDGREPTGFTVSAPEYPAVTLGTEELIALAIAQRPELDYFDAKALELENKQKVAKAGLAPSLAFTAGYQYKSNTLVGLMGQDAFALGFAINVPFQIKKQKSAVDEAKALGVANEASKDAVALKIAQRIVELRTALGTLDKKIALQDEKIIPEANLALELTLAAYSVQAAGITDVLTAFEKLLSADEKRSRLRGVYFATCAALQREVGTFDEPL
jgi:outer membrane protein TolC